jgi:hypothetical protein
MYAGIEEWTHILTMKAALYSVIFFFNIFLNIYMLEKWKNSCVAGL